MNNNTTKDLIVSIETKSGDDIQSTAFEMKEATELERIIIIHNIFSVMGVENSLKEMINDYQKIGTAYKNFFNKVDSIEDESTSNLKLKAPDTALSRLKGANATIKREPIGYSKFKLSEEYQKAMQNVTIEEPTAQKEEEKDIETSTIPEHYTTGIMKTEYGNKYQTRLICENCGFKKTFYINEKEKNVFCRACGHTHKKRQAKAEYMERDSHGNFFIAGKFVGEDELFKK